MTTATLTRTAARSLLPRNDMTFARRVFFVAGVYGLLSVTPLYFLEERLSRDLPPPIAHPEYFYGFLGVTLAWQLVFLVIARDPERYRPMMLPSILEKLSFGVASWLLLLQGRAALSLALPSSVDLVLAVLFLIAFWKTRGGAAAGAIEVVSSDDSPESPEA